ncbi:hypothetical protein B0I31_102388 [Saccharothrix carnea]|uniref:Uncharacterized protein n=1 Tax=Saccharothrix carnea TaxID=1280637 RepID=A0A2P8IG34_SACCR|nr:AI-2E family transporter [Saccharothrix carnea]PSL57410.1 hypothetical protein B0I31_102388 [Saccharothrix carnea]
MRLHPLSVVLAVAVDGVLAGITGALFAVPLVLAARSFLTDPSTDARLRHAVTPRRTCAVGHTG